MTATTRSRPTYPPFPKSGGYLSKAAESELTKRHSSISIWSQIIYDVILLTLPCLASWKWKTGQTDRVVHPAGVRYPTVMISPTIKSYAVRSFQDCERRFHVEFTHAKSWRKVVYSDVVRILGYIGPTKHGYHCLRCFSSGPRSETSVKQRGQRLAYWAISCTHTVSWWKKLDIRMKHSSPVVASSFGRHAHVTVVCQNVHFGFTISIKSIQ